MADAAVKMAQAGCTTVAVLGVDFMSENVRAILDEAGMQHIKVGAEEAWLGRGAALEWNSRAGGPHSPACCCREREGH